MMRQCWFPARGARSVCRMLLVATAAAVVGLVGPVAAQVVPSPMSRSAGLRREHVVFASRLVAGMNLPDVFVPPGGFIDVGPSLVPGVRTACLHLIQEGGGNVGPRYVLRGRESRLGSTIEPETTTRPMAMLVLGAWSVGPSGASAWDAPTDRLELFGLLRNNLGDRAASIQLAGVGPRMSVVVDGVRRTGTVAVGDLLDRRIAVLIERRVETEPGAADGRITIHALDLTGAAPFRSISASRVRSEGRLLLDAGGMSGVEASKAFGAWSFDCAASGLASGSSRHEVEAFDLRTDGREPSIDLDVGLGLLVGADEGDGPGGASIGFVVHAPPGRFDATADDVWVRFERRDEATGAGLPLAGTVRRLPAERDFAASLRSGPVPSGPQAFRARFFDADPSAGGVELGVGPWLTHTFGRTGEVRIGTAFCLTHTGQERPGYGWGHLDATLASDVIHFPDDFSYPTGQLAGLGGNSRGSEEIDFVECLLMLYLEPTLGAALRTTPITIAPGDHNFGLDAITVNDHASEAVLTDWRGRAVARSVIVDNATSAWHGLVLSGMPGVVDFDPDPTRSGFDYTARLPGGHVLHVMESVAYRGLVADSLASNASRPYPPSGTDQEAAFAAAASRVRSGGFLFLSTVRVNGPGQLTYVDNWFEGRMAGFGRLVDLFRAHAPPDARLAVISGDRHIAIVDALPPQVPGLFAEITLGPMGARQYNDPTRFNNGDASVITWQAAGMEPNGRARVLGRVTIPSGGGLVIEAYEVGDDGGLTRVGVANLADLRIVAQPRSVLTEPTGSEVVFGVMAEGGEPLSYQWRLDGVALRDGDTVVGSDTPTLRVMARAAAAGSYDCVVGNAAGSVVSEPAVLGFRAEVCPEDRNRDGGLDIFDILGFFESFAEGCVPGGGGP